MSNTLCDKAVFKKKEYGFIILKLGFRPFYLSMKLNYQNNI